MSSRNRYLMLDLATAVASISIATTQSSRKSANTITLFLKTMAWRTIILSLLMLLSFFSIFFSYNLFFIKNKNINFFYEDLHLIIYFLVITSIFLLFFSSNNDFLHNLLSISSSMSNIGFSFN